MAARCWERVECFVKRSVCQRVCKKRLKGVIINNLIRREIGGRFLCTVIPKKGNMFE